MERTEKYKNGLIILKEDVYKRQELNTMPGFAGSSASYLRYMDPHNHQALVCLLYTSGIRPNCSVCRACHASTCERTSWSNNCINKSLDDKARFHANTPPPVPEYHAPREYHPATPLQTYCPNAVSYTHLSTLLPIKNTVMYMTTSFS